MANSVIMELTINHNENITNKYLKQMRQNFYLMLIVAAVLEIGIFAIAVTSGNEATFAWGIFAIIALFAIVLSIFNIKGLQNCKYTLKKYEGAIYHYTFYEDKFIVKYQFQDKEQVDELKYEYIKNINRSNGLLSIVLFNSSLLFIDEALINDKKTYEIVLNKIMININDDRKKRKHK